MARTRYDIGTTAWLRGTSDKKGVKFNEGTGDASLTTQRLSANRVRLRINSVFRTSSASYNSSARTYTIPGPLA